MNTFVKLSVTDSANVPVLVIVLFPFGRRCVSKLGNGFAAFHLRTAGFAVCISGIAFFGAGGFLFVFDFGFSDVVVRIYGFCYIVYLLSSGVIQKESVTFGAVIMLDSSDGFTGCRNSIHLLKGMFTGCIYGYINSATIDIDRITVNIYGVGMIRINTNIIFSASG